MSNGSTIHSSRAEMSRCRNWTMEELEGSTPAASISEGVACLMALVAVFGVGEFAVGTASAKEYRTGIWHGKLLRTAVAHCRGACCLNACTCNGRNGTRFLQRGASEG